MNVLLTNYSLDIRFGTEVYIRDLAVELHNRGIHVEVYSPQLGTVAAEIRDAGIHVASSPDQLLLCPDIIHGQHFEPTVNALVCFPDTPAIYFVHDRTNHLDTPVKHSRIIKYLASDHNTLDRLVIDEGIPPEHVSVLLNWVDTRKFLFKEQRNNVPQKAVVFSNYASDANYLDPLRKACREMNISLDCFGRGVGKEIKSPEQVVGNYDIVFAKAKSAIEAMATGACVIACDFRGLGEMVTRKNYAHFRNYNFGMKILNRPITKESVMEEIKKYDCEEGKKCAALIREEASLPLYVDKLLGHYNEVITKYRAGFRVISPESGDVQCFETPGSIIINRVEETEKMVNRLLSDRLEKQQKYIQDMEAQVAHYKSSLLNRAVYWLKRKTGKGKWPYNRL